MIKITMGAKDLVELGRKGGSPRRWARFGPGYLPGWTKKTPAGKRHAALKRLTEREGCITVIRKLTQLRNVTTDRPTELLAIADARWLHNRVFCKLKTKKD
jgi:hypothetical protein